jgi:hypothetical protein
MPGKARCYSEKDQERVSSRHPPPLIDDFAEDLANSLTNVFPSDDEMLAQLRALVRHRDEIGPNVRQLLVNELQALAVRATEFANDLAVQSSDFARASHALPHLQFPPDGGATRGAARFSKQQNTQLKEYEYDEGSNNV